MREIKFRAWSGERMVPVLELDMDEDGLYVNGGDLNPEDGFWIGENAAEKTILMQYTGLKDKNGKEIYEGDILKSNTGIVGPVEWDEPDAKFYWMHGEMVNLPMCYGEVVGNIYENPELLKHE